VDLCPHLGKIKHFTDCCCKKLLQHCLVFCIEVTFCFILCYRKCSDIFIFNNNFDKFGLMTGWVTGRASSSYKILYQQFLKVVFE